MQQDQATVSKRSFACLFAVLAMMSIDLAGVRAEGADEPRVSISKHYRGERDGSAPILVSRDERTALLSAGKRTGATTQKPGVSSRSSAASTDFWFYAVDVQLFRDDDRDGYHAGIDLLFDADTIHLAADVYAVVYLSYEGGPWNEYAATDDFTIYGQTSDDDYVIVTDLVSGYPTGSYDILIELFDAWDDTFLAWIGPEDSSELGFLPLEDQNRDAPAGGGGTVVVNTGGGGALSLWVLLWLASAAALLRSYRAAPAAAGAARRAVRNTLRHHAARLSK